MTDNLQRPDYRQEIVNALTGAYKPRYEVSQFGRLFGMGPETNRPQPHVRRGPKILPYTPSPSENRSFLIRQKLGQYVGKRVNNAVDAVDPITPMGDFIHRRQQGYPLGAKDALLALDTAATVASPFAGKVLVDALRNVPKFYRGAGNNIDLGHIHKQVEKASDGRQPEGPIRMEWGEDGPDGFGAWHIPVEKHERARELGYQDGYHLIEDVAAGYTEVIEQGDRLMLVKSGPDEANRYTITEFRRGSWLDRLLRREPYHVVTTGFPEGSKHVGKETEMSRKALKKPGNRQVWKSEP